MFCSSSILVHLLRGIGAIICIALAVYFGAPMPLIALPLVVCAILLLRGCPMCWLMGLIETIKNRKSRQPERP